METVMNMTALNTLLTLNADDGSSNSKEGMTLNADDGTSNSKEGLLSLHAFTIGYYYVLMPTRTLLLLLGMSTSALCIRAFYRSGVEDSVTVMFFVQAFLDFVILVLNFTYPLLSLMGFIENMSSVRLPFEPVSFMVLEAEVKNLFLLPNCMNTTFLAVQRCLCVAMPLQFKGIFTRKRTVIILASIFLSHALLTLILLAHYQLTWVVIPPNNASRLYLRFKPNKKLWASVAYYTFHIVLNTANQVIITVCVLFMANVLIKSVRFRVKRPTGTSGSDVTDVTDVAPSKASSTAAVATTTSVLKDTKEIRVIKQVALVCTIYITCNVPRFCYFFAKLIEPEFDMYMRYERLLRLSYSVKMFFEIMGSSLNFFVYYRYNETFRRACFGAVKKNP